MARVCILIPHHGHSRHLRPLFSSLLQMNIRKHEVQIVLVDNASQDDSVELTQREFPDVEILSLDQNLGFAPALNQAAVKYDAEWLCFLNNDVRVDPDWISNLLYSSQKIDAHCFSSHILNWEGNQTTFAGGWINLFGKGFESTKVEHSQPYEIFFPCGCGTFIRRELFLKIGGFDGDYFMIYEDVDLGWRLRLAGQPIYLVPDAFIMHRAHASLNRIPYSQKAIYFERNSLATLYKNLEIQHLNLILPLALQEILLRAQAIAGIGFPYPHSYDGTSILEAVKVFFDRLDGWREKRGEVQKRRMVGDHELMQCFLPHPTQIWAFNDSQYQRLAQTRIDKRIQTLLETARQHLKLKEII